MKYKMCGTVAILLLSSAEKITGNVKAEIDAKDGATVNVYRLGDKKVSYCGVKSGCFEIPADFLSDGTYAVKVVSGKEELADGTSFCVISDTASCGRVILRNTESTPTEIANMWKAIAAITTMCEKTQATADAAVAAVMKFEKGYQTE